MWDSVVAHKYTILWHEHKKQGEEKNDLMLFGTNSYILVLVSVI